MYKLIATIVILAAGNVVLAQNHYTIRIFGGMGSGTLQEDVFPTGKSSQNFDISTICIAGIGYNISNLRLSVGAGILAASVTQENLVSEIEFDPVTGNPVVTNKQVATSYIHRHIIIPVTAGYCWHLNKKLTLVPEAGIIPAWNAGILLREKDLKTNEITKHNLKSNTMYNDLSLSGIAALSLEYYITGNIGFSAGATYTHMFTNLFNVPKNAPYKASSRIHTYGGNIGILLKL